MNDRKSSDCERCQRCRQIVQTGDDQCLQPEPSKYKEFFYDPKVLFSALTLMGLVIALVITALNDWIIDPGDLANWKNVFKWVFGIIGALLGIIILGALGYFVGLIIGKDSEKEAETTANGMLVGAIFGLVLGLSAGENTGVSLFEWFQGVMSEYGLLLTYLYTSFIGTFIGAGIASIVHFVEKKRQQKTCKYEELQQREQEQHRKQLEQKRQDIIEYQQNVKKKESKLHTIKQKMLEALQSVETASYYSEYDKKQRKIFLERCLSGLEISFALLQLQEWCLDLNLFVFDSEHILLERKVTHKMLKQHRERLTQKREEIETLLTEWRSDERNKNVLSIERVKRSLQAFEKALADCKKMESTFLDKQIILGNEGLFDFDLKQTSDLHNGQFVYDRNAIIESFVRVRAQIKKEIDQQRSDDQQQGISVDDFLSSKRPRAEREKEPIPRKH